MTTKYIIIGSLFAALAVLFQLTPYFYSELFVVFTMFSAVPIYIVSRINPKVGMLSYSSAGIIVMILRVHEGLFFLCTNGIIGMSLGICSYYTKKKVLIWGCSSLILAMTLSIMNYVIGIPVLGVNIPGGLIIQIQI